MYMKDCYGPGVVHIGLLRCGESTCGVMSVPRSGVQESAGAGSSEHRHRNGIKKWYKHITKAKTLVLWSGDASGAQMGVLDGRNYTFWTGTLKARNMATQHTLTWKYLRIR